MLIKVMEKGKITYNLPSIDEIRTSVTQNLAKLPGGYKTLTDAPVYQVELSQNLQKLIKNLKRQFTINEINGVSKTILNVSVRIYFCIYLNNSFRFLALEEVSTFFQLLSL